jgi:hypothetical protein
MPAEKYRKRQRFVFEMHSVAVGKEVQRRHSVPKHTELVKELAKGRVETPEMVLHRAKSYLVLPKKCRSIDNLIEQKQDLNMVA